MARSGYVNLLQPQDRRSKNPGDTVSAVLARRKLHDRGITGPLQQTIAAVLAASSNDVILDVGCGEGFYTASLAQSTGADTSGVDISIPAIDSAARRHPDCNWLVANADRFIPFPDQSFSIVISITARMNSDEFRRVLQSDGRLLVAVPSPDDLIEIRGAGRDRVQTTVQAFSGAFRLIHQHRVTTNAALDAEAVTHVLHSIYRPLQSKQPEAMQVTFSLDLLLFEPVRTA